MADTRGAVSIRPAIKLDPKDMAVGQELGVTNILPASSWMDWNGSGVNSPHTMAVGRDPLAPTQDEMIYMLRRDGQARAMLNLLTLPIRAAFAQGKWVEPEGGAEEETKFANDMWTLPSTGGGMEVPSSMFLRQTLLALAHGFSTFEIVRQIPDEGPLKGKLTIQKMGYRDPRTITYLVDDHGGYQGFRQVTNFGMRAINVVIRPEDSWYWAANEEENPYYGVSYFEPAYQHYMAKRKLYYVGELASQLAAVPGRIGEIPLGASPRQITEFKRSLSNFAFNTAMVVPPNFKVTPFNSNSGFKFLELIDHHNTMMAGSILAKFLQQEDRMAIIDNSTGDAASDMFVQLLAAITDELAESWSTKLMPQFMDANFGTNKYPLFRFAPMTDENKQTIKELFELFVPATSLNCTPEFVRITEQKMADRLGYDIDYAEVASKEAEIASKQQAQMEADAEAARQAQVAEASAAGQPGTSPAGNGNGRPVPGQKNTGGNPNNSVKPKQQPGNPAAKKPLTQGVVKTSATSIEEQQLAADQLAVLLSNLFQPEDVPDDYAPEGTVLPEAGE